MHHKKGFTLFELLIVVSLIGLFFVFIVPNILHKQTVQRDSNLSELKSYISNYRVKYNIASDIIFECKNDFKKCVLRDVNATVIEDGLELNIEEANNFKVYDFDPTGKEYEVNFDGVKAGMAQRVVFFSLNFYKNGTTDSFVVFDGKKYYAIDACSNDISKFDTIDDAKKKLIKYDKLPLSDSKYYINE